ncbi:MAG: alanine dehydrogenase [Erysipelotrichaceae bacterium]|nr:alanine dehydrogenase [Erysipelotrichaceae bacterium]
MKTAIIATSRKEEEKRVPIHPEHIEFIPKTIRNELYFEQGYGESFGVSDNQISSMTGNEAVGRSKLLSSFHSVIITKPMLEDFKEVPDGSTVWGWIHSVQQSDITQTAIRKKLTLIAWENMYNLNERGMTHIFQKNNEMAGYCGVQHALQLRGIDGNFGPERSAIVLGFGSVSRGAIYALQGHGINRIKVITMRPSHVVSDRIPGLQYMQMQKQTDGTFMIRNSSNRWTPIIDELTQTDIIVNGVIQDPTNPSIFIQDHEIKCFTKECLIIDISCDNKMGFSFAHPTDFSHPICQIGNILYYAVDHIPTLLWNSATWEISTSLLPYLPDFVQKKENPVLKRATDMRHGIILNKDILAFQNRSHHYPYTVLDVQQTKPKKA